MFHINVQHIFNKHLRTQEQLVLLLLSFYWFLHITLVCSVVETYTLMNLSIMTTCLVACKIAFIQSGMDFTIPLKASFQISTQDANSKFFTTRSVMVDILHSELVKSYNQSVRYFPHSIRMHDGRTSWWRQNEILDSALLGHNGSYYSCRKYVAMYHSLKIMYTLSWQQSSVMAIVSFSRTMHPATLHNWYGSGFSNMKT